MIDNCDKKNPGCFRKMAINGGLTAYPLSDLVVCITCSGFMSTFDFVCLLVVSIPRRGHDDEVLDVCFDFTGQYIATASADGKRSHLKYK